MKRRILPITKGMKAVYSFLMPFFSLIILSQNTNAQMASSGIFDAKQYNYGYINGSSFTIQSNVPITYSGSLNKLYPETTPPTAKIIINDHVLFDGKPEALVELGDSDRLYQQGLNRELEAALIKVEDKAIVKIEISGSVANYTALGGLIQSSVNGGLGGQTFSIYPVMSPSVFRIDALR